jgi:hypothetical protein
MDYIEVKINIQNSVSAEFRNTIPITVPWTYGIYLVNLLKLITNPTSEERQGKSKRVNFVL